MDGAPWEPIIVLAGTELEMGCEVWMLDVDVGVAIGVGLTSLFGPEAGGGTSPPERKDGHKERSSGKEADEGERCERMAAACAKSSLASYPRPNSQARRHRNRQACGARLDLEGSEKKKKKKTRLEQLHLLMFTQHKLGRFPPLRGMFPTMFDQTRGMSVNLEENVD